MYARGMSDPRSNRFAENRKARYDYETLETYEGGLVLTGQEVKSIREGGAKIDGAYVNILRGEMWLISANIRPYARAGNLEGYDAAHDRKILVHAKELAYLAGKTQEKGLTLVPFSLYASGRQIKLSFGLCRGKKTHDKRESLKAKTIAREITRHLRGRDEE